MMTNNMSSVSARPTDILRVIVVQCHFMSLQDQDDPTYPNRMRQMTNTAQGVHKILILI